MNLMITFKGVLLPWGPLTMRLDVSATQFVTGKPSCPRITSLRHGQYKAIAWKRDPVGCPVLSKGLQSQ
jgi:hypothetical protein